MATLQIRVDDSLKQAADALFSSLGLDTSTAVRIFLNALGGKRGNSLFCAAQDTISLAPGGDPRQQEPPKSERPF